MTKLAKYRAKACETQRKARKKLRQEIYDIKSKAGCGDCEEKHPACLQFHHIDPATKLATINRAMASKMRRVMLMKEIAKCIVLCGNCHAKRHWLEKQK